MTISEFARVRGVEPQAVSRYLSRHPEIKDLTTKEGKSVVLSEKAMELLEKQYPLPSPVQVVQGVPQEEHIALLKKLQEKQDAYEALQEKMIGMSAKLAQAEATQLLLESKEKQLKETKGELEDIKIELRSERANRITAEEAAKNLEKDLSTATEEMERLKARGLWDRIFNK